jgi:Carboxypeptidase regulatory-like domain
MRPVLYALLCVACAIAGVGRVSAQQSATLSGTVYDNSGAVVVNASVEITNEASGIVRDTVTNASGFYTLPAIPPGSYKVTVTASGFKQYTQSGVVFTEGQSRTLPNLKLDVGSESQNVIVSGAAESTVPVDTGAVGTTLNNYMVSNISVVGRNAGELIKFMPGMGQNGGLGQGGSFPDQTVGTNSGPAGSFSANGTQPNGALGYYLNGVNIEDSNNGTQLSNINQDMVSEVQVMTSSYGADFPQGPTVFQAFSKSGGVTYHGAGYLYTRNSDFNAEDAFEKSQGIAKPYAFDYYSGGNLGGPIKVPHENFGNKLFFFAGYENMRQQPPGQLSEYFVPTPEMRAGNFSPAYLATLPSTVPGSGNAVPCPAPSATTPAQNGKSYVCNAGLIFNNGQLPSIAPEALALLKLYPQPNIDPATHSGNNYEYLSNVPQNRWEFATRIDYSISENTKLFGSYQLQHEKDIHPFAVFFAPSNALPYPSPIVAPTTSNLVTINLTHVFNPSLTNELIASYVRYSNTNNPENAAAITPQAIGFVAPTLFGATRKQFPNINMNFGAGLAGFYGTSFGSPLAGGSFGKILRREAVTDNVTKIIGTHNLKFGAYWVFNNNEQSSGGGNTFSQGEFDFENSSSTGTGNPIADFMLGRANSYSQASSDSVDNAIAFQYDFYAQDQWKVSRKLTLNYGLRATHLGQWFAPTIGVQVFDPSTYINTPDAPPNTGLSWHGINKEIPRSGFDSKFYYDPRVSLAYDIFGNGKTVFRGGFAVYHYPESEDIGGATEGAAGTYQYTTPRSLTSYADVASFAPSTLNQNGTSISALQKGYSDQPHVNDWNATVSQALPYHSVMEVSYLASLSHGLLIDGPLANLNNIPAGSFFRPDPITGVVTLPNQPDFTAQDYNPYRNYAMLTVVHGGSYSNYSALQVSWQKQSGPITFLTNYTFGKALGIRDSESDNGLGAGTEVNPFNLQDNYGVLAYDHTHIFNTAYVVALPSPLHENRIFSGVVNGWTASGGIQLQSGAPIQPNTGGNLNAQYPSTVSNSLNLGTTSISLMPVLTCDPRKGLSSGQRFNPSCFQLPAAPTVVGQPGQNGQYVWPYIKGPAYFDADLSAFKSFKVHEAQQLQFRLSAFNFINHPLPQFNANGSSSDLRLSFIGANNAPSQTNTNTVTNGKPTYEVGSRILELALKYTF